MTQFKRMHSDTLTKTIESYAAATQEDADRQVREFIRWYEVMMAPGKKEGATMAQVACDADKDEPTVYEVALVSGDTVSVVVVLARDEKDAAFKAGQAGSKADKVLVRRFRA